MTLNDAGKTMIQHVDASTYAGQVGKDLKRPISTLAADDLVFTNPDSSAGGGSTAFIFKRVK